jgi:hypothetical protein
MHKKSQFQKIFEEFLQIFTVQHRNLFQDSNIPKSYLTQIRGFSWHNNEIKKVRRVITVVITSKTQIKEKELKVKTLGYLPSVLFFNAFELSNIK